MFSKVLNQTNSKCNSLKIHLISSFTMSIKVHELYKKNTVFFKIMYRLKTLMTRDISSQRPLTLKPIFLLILCEKMEYFL